MSTLTCGVVFMVIVSPLAGFEHPISIRERNKNMEFLVNIIGYLKCTQLTTHVNVLNSSLILSLKKSIFCDSP